MQIVHVHVHVKPEFVEAFKQATVENASHSVKEAGIARFDVIQQTEDPTRFILVEVYKTARLSWQHVAWGIRYANWVTLHDAYGRTISVISTHLTPIISITEGLQAK